MFITRFRRFGRFRCIEELNSRRKKNIYIKPDNNLNSIQSRLRSWKLINVAKSDNKHE